PATHVGRPSARQLARPPTPVVRSGAPDPAPTDVCCSLAPVVPELRRRFRPPLASPAGATSAPTAHTTALVGADLAALERGPPHRCRHDSPCVSEVGIDKQQPPATPPSLRIRLGLDESRLPLPAPTVGHSCGRMVAVAHERSCSRSEKCNTGCMTQQLSPAALSPLS
ncbi:unnamed protein product, partial [Urochloa humidicola]